MSRIPTRRQFYPSKIRDALLEFGLVKFHVLREIVEIDLDGIGFEILIERVKQVRRNPIGV